jgi:hypothetical protein
MACSITSANTTKFTDAHRDGALRINEPSHRSPRERSVMLSRHRLFSRPTGPLPRLLAVTERRSLKPSPIRLTLVPVEMQAPFYPQIVELAAISDWKADVAARARPATAKTARIKPPEGSATDELR